MSQAQYSPSLEAYIASVVAVGGDWPDRVQLLRSSFPNNEHAFRTALEKQVLAAHEKARQGGGGGPQQQHQQSNVTAGSPLSSQDAQARPFPGGRSYPGQQQGPATPSAANGPGTPSQQQQQQQHSSSFIPYAHQQSQNAYIPYARDTIGPQQSGRPPSGGNVRRQTQLPVVTAGINGTPAPASPPVVVNTAVRPIIPARQGSGLNPAATRQPRILPIPVTKSHEPLPPYFPISTSQAYLTTYPARVKLGLTSLAQPLSSSGQVLSANPRAVTATAKRVPQAESSTTNLGKRQRSRVDYTERLRIPEAETSSSESGSSDEDDDNDTQEDAKLSRAVRAAKRAGLPVPISSVSSTPRDSPMPESTSKRKRDKAKEDVGGGGRTWLGQDPPGDMIQAQPARRHILPYINEHLLEKKANEKALLVPIRVELDTETHRIRDSFMWSPSESFITPELFARIFCLDIEISPDLYAGQIAQLIKAQLDEHSGVAEVSLLDEEQEEAGQEADLRVILNLDVQIGTLHLIDRVEWDLTSSLTPEAFALQMCADLGLGGEAVMLVAHAVHEELLRLKKDCIELGLVGGANDSTSKGPRKLESVWRDWNEAKAFVPHLEILSPEDIDALEFEKEKNPRRLFSRRNYDSARTSGNAARDRGGRRR